MSYQGKRVLILGGTGFVGGRLAERLMLEHGAIVRVSVRDWRKSTWISRTSAELVFGDVVDLSSMHSAVRGCDVVFHCASGPADSGGYMRTNRSGTENVIRACEEAGVQRLVYVSSVAVHGAKAGLQLSSATPLLKTGRDYSDSKIVAEELIRTAHETSRLCAVIVRPTYVWGPRSAVFTVRQLREMRAGLFRYVDRGCSVANAVYVDNLVDALIGAGVEQEAAGRAFLVTDGSAYCWQELFDGYARMLSLGTFRSVSSRSWIDRGGGRLLDASETALLALRGPRSLPVRVARRAIKLGRDALRSQFVDSWELNKYSCDQQADISVTRRCLGYEPRIALAQGLELTERWVRDQLGFEFNLEVNT